ncbi:hypothetical protein BH23THE1_BH23THE1_12450 [soil metagenome]
MQIHQYFVEVVLLLKKYKLIEDNTITPQLMIFVPSQMFYIIQNY